MESDGEAIRASIDGNAQAYSTLIERHQAAISQLLWRFTRDPRVLEELIHDTFVEAYVALRGYRGRGRFSAWLRTIATRRGYRYWKEKQQARARTTPLERVEHTAVESPSTDALDAAERLEGMLERLSPRDRLVLTLLYYEDCSVAETAKLVGWSQALVKVQAHRARKRLRRILEEKETP